MDIKPDAVLRLYPPPIQELPLPGLYLGHDVRQQRPGLGRPFVYGNFVSSLDGRIAIAQPGVGGMTVPRQIANSRDWRLFQELAVQADVIISSGRYLRDYAAGRAQEILRVYEDPAFADLRQWRLQRGLPPQPDIAVVSASLDFPIPAALTAGGRRVVVFTVAQGDAARRRELEAHAGQVIVAGDNAVQGDQLVQSLGELGYQVVYSASGPKIMYLLLAAQRLDRLYLTLTGRILGGNVFSTIVEGSLLSPPVDMPLASIYYDRAGLDGVGQLYLRFDRSP